MEPISPDVVSPTGRCCACEQVKPAAEFSRDRSRPSGLFRRCKPCDSEINRRRRREEPAFAEAARARGARWRQENPDYLANWRAQNPEYMKEWHARRPLYNRLNMGWLRADRAGNDVELITEEQLLAYWESVGIDPSVCYYTGESLLDVEWHIDHKTPVSRGGTHTLDNLVPCSASVNCSKHSRTADEFMQHLSTSRSDMTKDQFWEEFRALYHASGMSLDAAAGRLCASRPTVARWIEGSAAPHRVGRRSAIEVMRHARDESV